VIILRPSQGLGDAVYMRPVVRHYLDLGNEVVVVTRHPGAYSDLNCKTVAEEDFMDCQASSRTMTKGTNIYQDTLIASGIDHKQAPQMDLRCVGVPRDFGPGNPVCVVRNPSVPVKGDDSARCMVPDIAVFQRIMDTFKDRVRFVLIGWRINFDVVLRGAHEDLTGITSLRDYFAAVAGADLVLTQPGHMLAIAEALHKPLLAVFAHKGLASTEKRYRFTTPDKVLTSPRSHWTIDAMAPEDQFRAFEAVLGELRVSV
jgi:hypothetical protein